MQTRLQTLQRLVSVYGTVEEMHWAELQRMTKTVNEVQDAIEIEMQISNSTRLEGKGALVNEDRIGWEIAETRRARAGWRQRDLERIQAEQRALQVAAHDRYTASRLKSEQIKSIAGDMRARAEIEEQRRSQAASDDRFLARKRWSDTRQKKRMLGK